MNALRDRLVPRPARACCGARRAWVALSRCCGTLAEHWRLRARRARVLVCGAPPALSAALLRTLAPMGDAPADPGAVRVRLAQAVVLELVDVSAGAPDPAAWAALLAPVVAADADACDTAALLVVSAVAPLAEARAALEALRAATRASGMPLLVLAVGTGAGARTEAQLERALGLAGARWGRDTARIIAAELPARLDLNDATVAGEAQPLELARVPELVVAPALRALEWLAAFFWPLPR